MSSNPNLSLEEIFYVYIFIDPRNGLPFYVGKGKGNRWKQHFWKSSLFKNTPKNSKLKKILSLGLEVIVHFYIIDVPEHIAYITEEALIQKYGRIDIGTGILTNCTSGGDGVRDVSEQVRKELSIRASQRRATEEQKAERSRRMKGSGNHMFGRSFSEEHRAKISEGNQGKTKGVPRSQKDIEAIKKGLIGKNSARPGAKNGMAKTIHIFDQDGNLRFVCNGNFIEVTKKNGLPTDALGDSYRNNGKPLYPTRNYEYKGWYAISI